MKWVRRDRIPSTSTTATAAIDAAATGPNRTAAARWATAEKPIVLSCLRTPIASTAIARPSSGASCWGCRLPSAPVMSAANRPSQNRDEIA